MVQRCREGKIDMQCRYSSISIGVVLWPTPEPPEWPLNVLACTSIGAKCTGRVQSCVFTVIYSYCSVWWFLDATLRAVFPVPMDSLIRLEMSFLRSS